MSTTHNSGPEMPSKSERVYVRAWFAGHGYQLNCFVCMDTGCVTFIVSKGPEYHVLDDWCDVLGLTWDFVKDSTHE